MKSRLLLDIVVRQSATVLQLLSGEDEALLVRRDACGNGSACVSLEAGYNETHPSLSWILDLTLSIVSLDSTSSVTDRAEHVSKREYTAPTTAKEGCRAAMVGLRTYWSFP